MDNSNKLMSKKVSRMFLTVIIVIVIMAVILGAIYGMIYLPRTLLENTLNDLSTTDDVPPYMIYGTLYDNNQEIQIARLCRKENSNYSLQEVFCINERKVFFICSDADQYSRDWLISSINLDTLDFEICYRFSKAAEIYTQKTSSDFKSKNGFYYDGKIVLNDHSTVVVYDLKTGAISNYAPTEYTYPVHENVGKCIDGETLELTIGGISTVHTFKKMSEGNESISKIYELKKKQIWNGNASIVRFFSDYSIQCIDNRVYVVSSCMNYAGESHAIILEYDLEVEKWLYVTSNYAGDNVHGNCYVITKIGDDTMSSDSDD